MPRSYWGIILAIVVGLGLLASAGGYYVIEQSAHPKYAEDSYQPARDASLPKPAIAGQLKAQEYDPHCKRPNTATDGDLCAQWSAVKAVDESNRLTRLNILIAYVLGALGVVATGIGAILVFRSLQQTDAALSLARDSSKQELRAYVDFDDTYFIFDGHDERKPINIPLGIAITLKNFGNTPANKVVFKIDVTFELGGHPLPTEHFEQDWSFLSPNAPMTARASFKMDATVWDMFGSKQGSITCPVAVSYEDAFEGKHELTVTLQSDGRALRFLPGTRATT